MEQSLQMVFVLECFGSFRSVCSKVECSFGDVRDELVVVGLGGRWPSVVTLPVSLGYPITVPWLTCQSPLFPLKTARDNGNTLIYREKTTYTATAGKSIWTSCGEGMFHLGYAWAPLHPTFQDGDNQDLINCRINTSVFRLTDVKFCVSVKSGKTTMEIK